MMKVCLFVLSHMLSILPARIELSPIQIDLKHISIENIRSNKVVNVSKTTSRQIKSKEEIETVIYVNGNWESMSLNDLELSSYLWLTRSGVSAEFEK